MANPKVSVVVVTWNNEKEIYDCLQSLYEQTYENFNLIVVDNASSDKTIEIIKLNFPEVNLLKQTKNLYLTGGNNFGINYAFKYFDPKYVMVMNPDTKSEKNLIEELVKVAESDNKIGAVGPKIKFWKNSNEGLLNSTGLIYDGFVQAYDRGIGEQDKGQFDKQEEVPAVSGTCILYRTETLKKVGLYWESIKLYLDELELSLRIRKAGYKIVYTPTTTVHHAYMVSTTQNAKVKVNKQKLQAWLFIAMRHYPLKSKLAMLKHYLLGSTFH